MPNMTQQTPVPIALLTDFGTSDAYVGTMKGVLLRQCPTAQLIDLTHDITPQNVSQAAFVLWTAYRYFPANTVFLVVVDPGVGSERQAIAIETQQGRYVGPDNGVFGEVLTDIIAWRGVALDPAKVGLQSMSHTFHGRDLFAPAAAQIACGSRLDTLGHPFDTLVTLEPARLFVSKDTIEGEILYLDHFGNAVTNIGVCSWRVGGMLMLQARYEKYPSPVFFPAASTAIYTGPHTFTGIARTYMQAPPGQALPLINSAGFLEIAVNQGSAQASLGLSAGEKVVMRIEA
jgi:S-adenosylmethionine hydrolase